VITPVYTSHLEARLDTYGIIGTVEQIIQILQYILGTTVALGLLYLRIRASFPPKDLGDGGIQRLFDDRQQHAGTTTQEKNGVNNCT
jgi:hypothetical protein